MKTKGKKHIIKSKEVLRVIYKLNGTLHVFRFGTTSNKKIAPLEMGIIQTYHFSRGQFDLANCGQKITMHSFFAADADVCFDCPFSVSNGAKLTACYTHKMQQYSGFLSSLRSINTGLAWDEIPEFSEEIAEDIVTLSKGLYIRFGTYGEPSLIPLPLMRSLCNVATTWTGYTHQWAFKPEYSAFLMASCHSEGQAKYAASKGWRSFVAAKEGISGLVNCPASEEAGNKTTCNKCGLCSGSEGKGKKSVWILEH